MARVPDEVLAEIRARLPLESVVGRLVRLKRSGNSWRGACPLCRGEGDRFSVRQSERSFNCFGCGAHGDVFAFVMATEGCDFPEAVARCAAEAGVDMERKPGERRVVTQPAPAPPPPRDDTARIEKARRKWDASRPILPDTPQALYLRGRGLWPLPLAAQRVLRAVELEHMDTGRAVHDVMIARVDDADGRLTAVHCTYLAKRRDGLFGKLSGVDRAKLVFGALPPGAAIRLMEPQARMGVAEGIETALAAAELHRVPAWAAISAGGIEKFAPPPICAELLVFADRDKPRVAGRVWQPEGRGMAAARALAQRMIGRCQVRIRLPLAPAEDYADVLAAKEQGAA